MHWSGGAYFFEKINHVIESWVPKISGVLVRFDQVLRKEMQLRAMACVFFCVLLGGACAEETAVDNFAAIVAAEPEDKVPRCTIYALFLLSLSAASPNTIKLISC